MMLNALRTQMKCLSRRIAVTKAKEFVVVRATVSTMVGNNRKLRALTNTDDKTVETAMDSFNVALTIMLL